MELDDFLLSIKAPTSRFRTFILLKGCFRKLKQNKIIKDNPFDYIESIKKPKVEEKYVPTSDVLNIFFIYLDRIDHDTYVFAKFISLTGLRKGEALALQWGDISNKININKSFNTVTGDFSTPKTH
ncbi:site-specific integrase [Mycoplasmatota bacterium WC30]